MDSLLLPLALLRSGNLPVSDLYALVERDWQHNGKKSLDDVQTRWRLHLEPALGKLKAVSVTSGMIKQYIDAPLGKGQAD